MYQLHIGALVKGGLTATYYRPEPPSFDRPGSSKDGAKLLGFVDSSLGTPVQVRTDETVDFSANSSGGWGQSRGLGTYEPVQVRWSGVIVSEPHNESGSQEYEISVNLMQSAQRLRLWIDNLLLIDQWSSLQSLQMHGNMSMDSVPQPPMADWNPLRPWPFTPSGGRWEG